MTSYAINEYLIRLELRSKNPPPGIPASEGPMSEEMGKLADYRGRIS